jgi:DNA polymerase III subunit alpha
MIVFGKAIAEHEAVLAIDKVVLVRGRVDHKEAGKTCLVVQSVEAFAPSEEEIERARTKADVAAKTATALAHPVRLRVDVASLGASAIDDCKQLIEENPGPAEVVLEISTSTGTRRVRLGETYRVQHTPTLRAELEQALASVSAAAATA